MTSKAPFTDIFVNWKPRSTNHTTEILFFPSAVSQPGFGYKSALYLSFSHGVLRLADVFISSLLPKEGKVSSKVHAKKLRS